MVHGKLPGLERHRYGLAFVQRLGDRLARVVDAVFDHTRDVDQLPRLAAKR